MFPNPTGPMRSVKTRQGKVSPMMSRSDRLLRRAFWVMGCGDKPNALIEVRPSATHVHTHAPVFAGASTSCSRSASACCESGRSNVTASSSSGGSSARRERRTQKRKPTARAKPPWKSTAKRAHRRLPPTCIHLPPAKAKPFWNGHASQT